MMKQFTEEKTDYFSVFQELKSLGLKVPKLKKFKSSIPKQAKSAHFSSNKIFGISIAEQEKISVEDYLLPKFIVASTTYLSKYVDREIGLFRKAGSVSRQRDLRVKLERGESIENSEPNDVASLLKQWLRELPEPLIPVYLHDLFIRCLNLQMEENRVSAILLCCHLLPYDHFCTLKHLLLFLSGIAQHCDKNKMGFHNLALIMAPNIFVMGNDAIDKSSNDLVQQHTSVTELLIRNAHRVKCSAPHFHEAGALKFDTDLDLSTDVLDYSPSKSKKKRRSGGVQELFIGFKRLVGQNSLSPNRKRSYQDDSKYDTRSALKRKAEDEHSPSMSPLKKLAVASSVLHDETSTNTPNNKVPKPAPGTSEKSRKGHSRHKSFNLLKRKEKKRQKSVNSDAVDSKVSVSTPSPFQENVVLSLQVSAETKEAFFTPPSISPINFENLFAKSVFMKKSYSDCYLTPNSEKSQNKIFSTSSEGCLPAQGIASPGRGHALKAVDKMDSLNVPNVVLSQSFSCEISETVREKNSLFNAVEKSVSDINIFRGNVKDVNDDVPSIISVESKAVADAPSKLCNEERIKRNSSIARQEVFIIKPKNSRKSTISQLRRADSIRITQSRNSRINNENKNISSKSIQNSNSNNAAEGLLKRVDSIRISQSRINRINNLDNSQINATIIDSKATQKSNSNSTAEVFLSVKASENNAASSEKKRIKRNVRNASIIRGRPNTIRTGLPTDISNRYSTDTVSGNSKHKALSSSSSVDNDLFINVVKKSEKTDLDLSLISQIENLTLSPKKVDSIKEDEIKIQVSNCNKIIITLKNEESKTETEVTNSSSVTKNMTEEGLVESGTVNEICLRSKVMNLKEPESTKNDSKTVSKRKSRERLSSNSDGKIQKEKRKSAKVSRVKSFPDGVATAKPRKSATLRAVKSSSPEPGTISTTDFTKITKRKSRGRLCSNSDSKVHKAKRKSAKVSRINSFPDRATVAKSRKVEKLRAVKSSSPRKLCKREVKNSDNGDKENQCGNESQKQIFLNVKTPENKCKSPEMWFSGRKFLEAEEATKKEACDHKRESIAMILKNKRGHVREKASIYEPATRTSFNTTPMMLRSATPNGKFYDPQYSNMHSSQKRGTSTKSTKSIRRNSPLPPPPKFVIPEPSPIPSHPLKELTNLSHSEDIFFTPPSAPKSLNSPQIGENSSKKKKSKCTLKPKMNSYSGHTPYKLQSKVCRSESSPFLRNVTEKTKQSTEHLSANSPLKTNENYYSSPVFKTRSALSIEKLKSNELLDEWNCEM